MMPARPRKTPSSMDSLPSSARIHRTPTALRVVDSDVPVASMSNEPGQGGWTPSDVGIIGPTTPLRLETAAKLAFPDGSMKLAGLRREIARGRLAYEVIAGKHYTTLKYIEEMRDLCRVQVKDRASISVLRAVRTGPSSSTPSGSSSTEERKSPQELLQARLTRRLQKQRSSS